MSIITIFHEAFGDGRQSRSESPLFWVTLHKGCELDPTPRGILARLIQYRWPASINVQQHDSLPGLDVIGLNAIRMAGFAQFIKTGSGELIY